MFSLASKLIYLFFSVHSSKDDPYMVFAALHGGPNTKVVTEDYLRDHSCLLGEILVLTFFSPLYQLFKIQVCIISLPT